MSFPLCVLAGYPSGDLRAGLESQLRQNVLDVALGGSLRDHQFCSNLPVGHSIGHELCNLELPAAQDGAVATPCLVLLLLPTKAESDGPSPIESPSLHEEPCVPLSLEGRLGELVAATGVLL